MRFEKPALFVRGIQSKYVPDEALPIIGKFFPMFQLVDIGAGHWVISEQPEAFRRGMAPFSRTKIILTLCCPAVVEFLQPRDEEHIYQ